MRRQTVAVAMVLSGIVAAAPGPKAQPPKEAGPPALVGEWTVESRVLGGKPVILGEPFQWEFTAGGLVTFRRDGTLLAESKYTADPTKTPTEFDWTVVDGQKPLPGIYKVDKDTLLLCVDRAGTRPTKFESPDGSQVTLWTLKRVKKKD